MDTLLSGIDGVAVYLDDVLISGRDCDDLKRKTEKVLLRFKESGLRLKKEKCHFYVPEIEFLGMIIDHKGIHPSEEKLRAIKDARPPSNKRELMSFLGLLNYYERFLNNKATVAEPLHRLLDSNSPWKWNKEHQRSFAEVKNLISSKSVLAHFNEDLPILVNCDASEYGVGAILSQIDHGVERPVVFASRTLNKTERRYAVIDKEALAVIFGVSKFSQYLLGRKFKILTDHKPLVGIFNPKKPIPQVLSPRMLRWCLTLAACTYNIEYKPGKVNCNADALSRLPLNECPSVVPNPSEVFFIESEHAAINSSEVTKLTNKDPILSKVKFWAMNGWPERKVDDKFRDFVSKSSEISVHKDCLLWGSSVIIPERLRKDILNLLHDTHIGIVGTKALARGLCWWPKMDGDIERMISSCAMASFGNIENFDPSKPEKWTTYVERMIFFFLANGIEEITQKKAIFLTLIGPETYALARSLAAPKDLAHVNYEEILTILTGHFCPKPNVIVQRYHFNKHNQGNEPIATYIAELRRLSENCEFVDLDDRLRDRLVCGLKKESLVKRLLSEKDLTFEKAIDIALCDESASANASVLMETTPDVNILRKASRAEPPKFKSGKVHFKEFKKMNNKIICIRCKGNHMPNVCKFRNAKCFKCGKIGHLQKACLTRVKKFEYLNRSNSDTYLHCIGTESLSNPFYIMVKLDNHDVAMLIDSGSAYSLLNKETFLKYWRVTQLKKSEVLLKTWSSSNVKILGKLFVKAKVTNGFKKLSILVADGLGPNILGRQWFEAFRLRINFLNHIETNPFSSEFEEVFKQEIDAYNGPLIHIDIPENAEPKFVKARTVPFALRELVDKKLKSLEEQGVIEPVKLPNGHHQL
ncbi:K02A2.6-like [Cordylochernes scorpioides]|uniref:RNA-directed DNA polymerase n=1 Tax=Cordylochernes scorpioides TaxID=51811 RepID=A0ABY6KTC3_9ARAC|nr:K02A2.6-like [Cordylochernes scorpioides]